MLICFAYRSLCLEKAGQYLFVCPKSECTTCKHPSAVDQTEAGIKTALQSDKLFCLGQEGQGLFRVNWRKWLCIQHVYEGLPNKAERFVNSRPCSFLSTISLCPLEAVFCSKSDEIRAVIVLKVPSSHQHTKPSLFQVKSNASTSWKLPNHSDPV